MAEIDTAEEWRRLQELYAGMSEEELEAVANQGYDLTDIAKQALHTEIGRRNLKVVVRLAPPETEPEPEGDPEFDPADLDVTFAFNVENREEAEWAKKTLNDAGIPCYFGRDLQEDVARVKFVKDDSVDVAVLRHDLNRMPELLNEFARKFPKEPDPGPADFVRCPRCRSTDIMLLGPESDSPEILEEDEETDVAEESVGDEATRPEAAGTTWQWHCDACGHEWRDGDTGPET